MKFRMATAASRSSQEWPARSVGVLHSVSPALTFGLPVIGHFRGSRRMSAFRRVGTLPEHEAVGGLAGPRSIYVMTWGSGSCPKIPSSVEASGTDGVVIKTAEHDSYRGDTACTADLAVTTSVVRLPSSIDTTQALTAQIDGTNFRLAPRTS